ncbi:hypothetical protein FB45DRAFT_1001581 [Roridomyces roridus]|uniref:F-box domain-containing protein n=1 Tax=Roridomyces roridus TaxID=1738132 RepID=A0AAD7FPR0_9AGAR|nr:hypothetical protein FB45DRAFT_1001581 [Roridomyces roridus]
MNPDLAAIVNSNRAPNDIQMQQLRILLSTYVSEMSDLNTEISDTTALLRDMKNRRRTRSKLIAGLQSALAPIRTVPNEILGEIFLMYRNEALSERNYSVLNAKRPPLVLAHVSSLWRTVCLSDARLWDHIHVHSAARMPPTTTLKEIFKRSRMRPLDIHITETPLGGLFRVILGAHNRVQRVVLRLQSSDNISDFWSHPKDLPALTTFELFIERSTRATGVIRPFGLSLFKTAPLLQKLHIWAMHCPFDPRPGKVVWSQLTELTLELRIDQLTALSIIVACSRLQDCRIFFHTATPPNPVLIPSSPTSLPDLWRLRVFTREVHDALLFFEGLSLPALTELLLSVDELSPQALPNLYNRSPFHLKTLHIHIYMPRDFAAILNVTPSLEELSCRAVLVDDEVFESFTYCPAITMPFVLPKLRSLEIEVDELFTDGIAAAEMAESFEAYPYGRNLAFPSLAQVELTLGGDPLDEDVEERLEEASGGIFRYERLN